MVTPIRMTESRIDERKDSDRPNRHSIRSI